MNLPNDPYMLLSFVNMKLRDDFKNLDDFCKSFDVNIDDIIQKLKNIGYNYILDENQFKL